MSSEALNLELRAVYPRLLARLTRRMGSLSDAEDALQDAVERLLLRYAEGEWPDSVEAWLTTAAHNRFTDRVRRRATARKHQSGVELVVETFGATRRSSALMEEARGWDDDLLRLLFTTCDPALALHERVALTLATVFGLSTGEIAAAFLVEPRTMEQRLVRARKRLKERREELVVPKVEDIGARLPAALTVIHLVFNEGYWSRDDDAPIRRDLTRVATLACEQLRRLLPDEPEVAGLLTLLWLHEARADARFAGGRPVPLPEQDRGRWDRDRIAQASQLLREALEHGEVGPLQVEASIAAVHCAATHAAETDWAQIAALYGELERLRPDAGVRVNRAFAVGQAEGPTAGLALLDDGAFALDDAPYAAMVRGALLMEAGDPSAAAAALEVALAGAHNAWEAAEIERRLAEARGRRDAN